jgi:hypothetical protein
MPYQQYQLPDWMQRFTPNPQIHAGMFTGGFTGNFSDPNRQPSGGIFGPLRDIVPTFQAAYDKNQFDTWNPIRQAIDQATDPARLNQLFNVAMSNLRTQQAQAAGGAQAAAGAAAASRNLLNRGQFVVNAGNQARAGYVPAFGQLEEARARGVAGLADNRVNMLLLLQKAMSGDELARQELDLRRRALDQNEADAWDYFAAFLPGIGRIASGII